MKPHATVTDIGGAQERAPLDTLADACRILYAKGHMASLAGQIPGATHTAAATGRRR